jgi:hypothetical protein
MRRCGGRGQLDKAHLNHRLLRRSRVRRRPQERVHDLGQQRCPQDKCNQKGNAKSDSRLIGRTLPPPHPVTHDVSRSKNARRRRVAQPAWLERRPLVPRHHRPQLPRSGPA